MRVCVLKELPARLLEYAASREIEKTVKKARKKKRLYPRYANLKVARLTSDPQPAPAVFPEPQAPFEAGIFGEIAMTELPTAGDGDFYADFQDFILEDEFLPFL